jgi:hypothetical protein
MEQIDLILAQWKAQGEATNKAGLKQEDLLDLWENHIIEVDRILNHPSPPPPRIRPSV